MREWLLVLSVAPLGVGCTEVEGCTDPDAINHDAAATADDGSCIVVGTPYQGGVLAYVLEQGDPGYDPAIPHGLIAFPYDLSTGMPWSNGTAVDTGATSAAIGAGSENTRLIVEAQGPGDYAAAGCWNAVEGGREDWFLPSDHELDAITRFPDLVGGFDEEACYWSSTQLITTHSWMKCLNGVVADFGYYTNETPKFVRPVRAF